MENTDVAFKNDSRIHFGIYAKDLERSIAFYKELFKAEPSKVKEDYAKFELDDPSINLAISLAKETAGQVSNVSHFGIQVKSSDAVTEAKERFESLGWPVKVEEKRICCYAEQDKVWATDPDGNMWEIFVVTRYQSEIKTDKDTECCVADESELKEAETSCC